MNLYEEKEKYRRKSTKFVLWFNPPLTAQKHLLTLRGQFAAKCGGQLHRNVQYTFRVQMGYAMGAFDFGHFDNNGDWVIDYDSDRMWSLYKKQWTPEKILMGATIAVSVLTVAQKTCPAYQQSITVVESAAAKGVPINRLNHIFGKSEHALESLVTKFGSQEGAFNAVQNAANQALKAGKLTPNAEGILPAGDLGNIINVGGMDVRLIGGRVENGQVILSSFSRKGF